MTAGEDEPCSKLDKIKILTWNTFVLAGFSDEYNRPRWDLSKKHVYYSEGCSAIEDRTRCNGWGTMRNGRRVEFAAYVCESEQDELTFLISVRSEHPGLNSSGNAVEMADFLTLFFNLCD